MLTNMSRPICTSSWSESTSLVIRETITPGLLAVVEGHRQPLQVVEHADAQVAQEGLAEAADQLHLGPVGDVGEGGHDHVADDRRVEGARVVGA